MEKKYKGLKLLGVYDDTDPAEKIITYDHIVNTDSPTTTQYRKMVTAAKDDLQKLKAKNVKVKYFSGNTGNDIGLPYIIIQENIDWKSALRRPIKTFHFYEYDNKKEDVVNYIQKTYTPDDFSIHGFTHVEIDIYNEKILNDKQFMTLVNKTYYKGNYKDRGTFGAVYDGKIKKTELKSLIEEVLNEGTNNEIETKLTQTLKSVGFSTSYAIEIAEGICRALSVTRRNKEEVKADFRDIAKVLRNLDI